MGQKIIHLRSNIKDDDNTPKLPNSDDIMHGEIAINFAKGTETICFKNDNEEIVTISSDAKNQEQFNEVFIGDTISGNPDIFIDTSSDISIDVYTKEQVDTLLKNLQQQIQSQIIELKESNNLK